MRATATLGARGVASTSVAEPPRGVRAGLGHFRRAAFSPRGSRAQSQAATDAWRSGWTSRERDEVLRLAAEQNRGVGHTESDRAAMEAAIDALVAAAPPPEASNTSDARLSANWRLVWTSERETLFLLERWPGPGDTRRTTTQAYQRIDVNARTLQNAVVFCNGNTFAVDSTVTVDGDVRVNFVFDAARLELRRPFERTIPLPPVGKGWFDNLYVDDTMRVARDSRGDTLVVVRDDYSSIVS